MNFHFTSKFFLVYYLVKVLGIIITFFFSPPLFILNIIAVTLQIIDFETGYKYVLGGRNFNLLFFYTFLQCCVLCVRDIFDFQNDILIVEHVFGGVYVYGQKSETLFQIIISLILFALLAFITSLLTFLYLFIRLIIIIHDLIISLVNYIQERRVEPGANDAGNQDIQHNNHGISPGNQDIQHNNHGISPGNQDIQNNNHGISPGNQDIQHNNHGISPGNQDIQHNNHGISPGNQDIQHNNHGISPGNQNIQHNNHGISPGNQNIQHNNQDIQHNNHGISPGNQNIQHNNQDIQHNNHGISPGNQGIPSQLSFRYNINTGGNQFNQNITNQEIQKLQPPEGPICKQTGQAFKAKVEEITKSHDNKLHIAIQIEKTPAEVGRRKLYYEVRSMEQDYIDNNKAENELPIENEIEQEYENRNTEEICLNPRDIKLNCKDDLNRENDKKIEPLNNK